MNDEQIAFWNGAAGQRWTQYQVVLDRALRVFGQAALDAAAVRTGDTILDVGCGCGDSLLALADKAGATGEVVGVDISAPMLARARERAAQLPNVRVIELDATKLPEADTYDLIFSRFGLMFFDDPVAGMSRLHTLLRRKGRIAFVCWRTPVDNPWSHVTVDAIKAVAPEAVPPLATSGPGPYAFADRVFLERVMREAGYSQIAIERFDAPVLQSPDTLDAAMEFVTNSGPGARMLAEVTPEIRERATQQLRRVIAEHRTDQGYTMAGSSWVVTAQV